MDWDVFEYLETADGGCSSSSSDDDANNVFEITRGKRVWAVETLFYMVTKVVETWVGLTLNCMYHHIS